MEGAAMMPKWTIRPYSWCTHVYVAAGFYGHKIGISKQPPIRAVQAGHDIGHPAWLIRAWHRPTDARDVEATAHHLIAPFRARERRFEWFTVNEATAIATVEQAIAMVERGETYKSRSRREHERRVELDAKFEAKMQAGREAMAAFYEQS
jgi:hypothetical protein